MHALSLNGIDKIKSTFHKRRKVKILEELVVVKVCISFRFYLGQNRIWRGDKMVLYVDIFIELRSSSKIEVRAHFYQILVVFNTLDKQNLILLLLLAPPKF